MPTIRPPAPPVPDPIDPDSFEPRMFPYLQWLSLDQAAANLQAQEVSTLADQAAASAAAALATGAAGISTSTTSMTVGTGRLSWTVAAGKAYASGVSVTIARTSAPATVFMRGIVYSYNSGTGALVVDVGSSTGTGTFTDWTILASTAGTAGPVSETYEARSANIALTAADSGKWIDITAGTFTQTFAAFSALGNAWRCRIRNSGTGDITIPASDGRTNWIMYPGEVRDFNCDGSALRSVVVRPFSRRFLTTVNWVKPPGYANFLQAAQGAGSGGGGGGGGASAFGGQGPANYGAAGGSGGAPGQSGQWVRQILSAADLPNTVPIVVGDGGLGGAGGAGGAQASRGQPGSSGVAASGNGGSTTFGAETDPFYSIALGGNAGSAGGLRGEPYDPGGGLNYNGVGGQAVAAGQALRTMLINFKLQELSATTNGGFSTAGTSNPNTTANGAAGGAGASSSGPGVPVAGGAGGATKVYTGAQLAGNDGSTPAQAAPGQGGAGGGGGGGSPTTTSGQAFPGGSGAAGGKGGNGYCDVIGLV